MKQEQYNKLKKDYGATSSFALWSPPINGEKSNTGNLSIFEKQDFIEHIPTNYILIDLVANTRRRDHLETDWMAFHSDLPRQNEYKLRYALKNTPLWSCYMTPIFKGNQGITMHNFQRIIIQDESLLLNSIQALKEELSLFDKPTLIALGGNVYKLIRPYFQDVYKIIVIKHPSVDIKLEDYRKEIIEKASLNTD